MALLVGRFRSAPFTTQRPRRERSPYPLDKHLAMRYDISRYLTIHQLPGSSARKRKEEAMFGRHAFDFEGHGRIFGKGDLKYVILDLLKDKPSHGYEVMRALEDRFYGFYSPSAGTVYPTLQMLEDLGYVTSSASDGKKVYTITDEGKRFLSEEEVNVRRVKEHMKGWWDAAKSDELRETWQEMRRLGRLLGRKAHRIDREKLARVRQAISRACDDIEAALD